MLVNFKVLSLQSDWIDDVKFTWNVYVLTYSLTRFFSDENIDATFRNSLSEIRFAEILYADDNL